MTARLEAQNLNQTSPFIELYALDCSQIGGSTYYFTPHDVTGGSVSFQGNAYISFPIMTDGWELSTSGTQPRPTLTVSNVNKTLLNAVITLGDIVGARLTRIRTFEKFLDGSPDADTDAHFPYEVYYVEQKLSHSNEFISWQLASPIDRFGTMLPRRQILRDKGFPGAGRYRGTF